VFVVIALPEEKTASLLAEITALECGERPAKARQIRTATALHDIGKLIIPESIILKKGTLDSDEFEVIKTHTVLGAKMLSGIQGELGDMIRTVCTYHHEWYDGTKSYWGKCASDLPGYVPIVSICDVFTALASKRVYKEPWPPDKVLAYIQDHAGTQFDPTLAASFISLLRSNDRILAIFFGDKKQT
jgi:putative two-component system response regulator